MPHSLLYPAELDRYRIIQKLIRTARATYRILETGQQGIDQIALAGMAKVSQATLSNLENLERSVESRKRRVSREELLRVLTWGLALSPERINALLWLYDGELLTEDEIRRYIRGYCPHAQPLHPTTQELRRQVYSLLHEALDYSIETTRGQPVMVKIIFSGDERAILEADEELLHLERIPGQVLLVTEYPSHLTHPPAAHKSGELTSAHLTTDAIRQEWLSLNWKRLEAFIANLEQYGQRSIHCKPSLQKYLSKDFTHRLSLEQRRRHIEHWLTLLEKYEHYQVGLAEKTPAWELKIKSTMHVMMRSACRYDDDDRSHWGPRYVHWSDETSVLRFFLDFERAWEAIPVQDRSKGEVIAWLQALLQNGA